MSFTTTVLSSTAISVIEQLFICGPISDGNICSKYGRGQLVDAGLAFHENGWASLTADGIRVAVEWDRDQLHQRLDRRWIQKLRDS